MEETPEKQKKLSGAGFYIILALAALKDSLDVLENLTVLLAILAVLSSIFIYIIIWGYLWWNNVGFIDKWAGRKLAALIVPFLIEMIPFLNIVPATTLGLILMRYFENSERAHKAAERIYNITAVAKNPSRVITPTEAANNGEYRKVA